MRILDKNLLKYDSKNTLTVALPAYLMTFIAFICKVLFGWVLENLDRDTNAWIVLMLQIVYWLSGFLITLLLVVSVIWVIVDFYRTVFGKLGYLTHTLPVSPEEILHSKLLVGGSFILVSCVMVLLMFSYEDMSDYLEVANQIGASLIFSLIFVGIVTIVFQMLCLMTAVALGHLTRHKILMSFLFGYLLYQFVGNIPFAGTMIYLVIRAEQAMGEGLDAIAEIFWVYGTFSLLFCPIFYFNILKIMKKKLNLE